MKIYNIIFFIFVLVITSCSITTHYVQSGSQSYPESNYEEIKIYSGEPEGDYTVIGSLVTYAAGDENMAAKTLRKEAAEVGADAIIHTELYMLNTYSKTTGMTGVAIKFK